MLKKLILIRHGETEYSLKGWCCGQKDIPITSKGIGQAKLVHKALKSFKIDAVYTSDLQRVRHTAAIVFPGRKPIIRKTLREIDFGRFSGLTYPQIKRQYPREYATFKKDIINARIPGGERFSSFKQRIERALERILNENSRADTVAIVGHINPIRVMLLKITGESPERFWKIKQTPGAINTVIFKNNRPASIGINDTRHLKARP